MLIIFGPLLFAVFLNAMGSRAEEVQQVITCQAGSYFKGETASVTCNFHKDMNLDKRSISVARYLTIATTDATARETVLACQWKEEWTCEPKSNFIVRGVINNLLTVEVPAVTADNAGVYICFVIPAKETVSHHCNLSIKADAGMSIPYTTPGVLPSNDTHLSQETEKDESSHVLKIALPIVVVVIGLPVTGILCFCLYKHRSARNVMRAPEDGQQNSTPEELSPLTGASEMNGGGSAVGRTTPSKCTPYEQFKREPSEERSSTVTSSAERPTSITTTSETPPPLPSQPTSTATNSNANDVIDNVISLRALATTTNTNTANDRSVICHVVSLYTLASAALVAAGINHDS